MSRKRPPDDSPAGTCLRQGRRPGRPEGFTVLELEVALVVFGIALTGLVPHTVMYTKQLKRLEDRFRQQTTYYLLPSSDLWVRKLGAAASLTTQDPGAPSPPESPPAPANDVRIASLEKSLLNDGVTAHVTVQVSPP